MLYIHINLHRIEFTSLGGICQQYTMHETSNLLICFLLLLHHTFFLSLYSHLSCHHLLNQDQSIALLAELSVWRILAQNSNY